MTSIADTSTTPRVRRRRRKRSSRTAVEPHSNSRRASPKRTVMEIVGQLPTYLRLLAGLFTDPRVSRIDKLLVGAAIAYIAMPVDMIPDFIPFLGQVDDVFLLVTALERLMTNAGRRVVLSHWHGDPADLKRDSLRRAVMAATFFLPRRMRRRLRVIGRRP